MDDGRYQPMLMFDTNSKKFVRGFECGRVWAMLKNTDEREFIIHWTNSEMMFRIADALHLDVKAEQLDDVWANVIFEGDLNGN